MGTASPEVDLKNYPLLADHNVRMNTIIKYLSYELYSYPELRKILRDKYYKKEVFLILC
jgi:hypothetical protein